MWFARVYDMKNEMPSKMLILHRQVIFDEKEVKYITIYIQHLNITKLKIMNKNFTYGFAQIFASIELIAI